MEWPRVPLAEIAPASPADIQFAPTDIVWHLGLEHIESHTGTVTTKWRAPAAEAGTSTLAFDDGNVLYSKLRPYLNKVVMPDEPGFATTELIPLRPVQNLLGRKYLAYYLRSQPFLSFASQFVTGAKMPRVILDKFWAYEVPLPPISEQRRIVEILDQADRLRRLRAEADAKADRIIPALFIKMFGDPATNPMEWPVVPLENLGELDRGRSRHRPRNDPALLGGTYALIQTGDVANCDGRIRSCIQSYSEFGLAQSRMWPAGTLCITIAANIARTGVLEFDACFPDSVVGFRPGSTATTEYVQFVLHHLQPVLERQAPQLAQKNINLEVLRRLSVPRPPKELQNAFSRRVALHYTARFKQVESSSQINSLFNSAMHRAFSGALTRSWRKAHMKELLQEIEQQARALGGIPPGGEIT